MDARTVFIFELGVILHAPYDTFYDARVLKRKYYYFFYCLKFNFKKIRECLSRKKLIILIFFSSSLPFGRNAVVFASDTLGLSTAINYGFISAYSLLAS